MHYPALSTQLSREIHKQIRVKKVVSFKALWWLSAVMGQHNRYEGEVYAYEPVFGTGSAVCGLWPSAAGVGEKEFDEEDVENWRGDRDVIAGAASGAVTRGSAAAADGDDDDDDA